MKVPSLPGQRARYVLSRMGRDAEQKYVIYFHPHAKGTVDLYVLHPRTRTKNLVKLTNELERAGIPFSTVVPSRSTTAIYIIDLDRDLREKILAAARKLRAQVNKETVLGETGRLNMITCIALMVVFVTMVYGPIAAFLVELFPTRIRYTSMSLPYHIGNGVFGGLVPFIATLITTLPGTTYLSGLWYPIIVAALCFVIGSLYLSNKIETGSSDS